MRTIQIDFDVHKRIEAERQNFNDTENDVLRRLLNLGKRFRSQPSPSNNARPWSGKGVTLEHGTKVRMEYNGRVHLGEISNGVWLVEGKQFSSPSAAAKGIATTKDGRPPSLNGWIYWQIKVPDSQDWIEIATLKPEAGEEGDRLLASL